VGISVQASTPLIPRLQTNAAELTASTGVKTEIVHAGMVAEANSGGDQSFFSMSVDLDPLTGKVSERRER